jgi:hypothetical protein
MTNTYTSYAEIQERSRKRLEAVKRPLIETLQSLAANDVVAEYDGEGDSGQIHAVYATGIDEKPIDLALPVPASLLEAWGEPFTGTLETFIEEFAWDALGFYHDGFEIDGGGFGTLTIDVGQGAVRIDHSARIIDVVPFETEF